MAAVTACLRRYVKAGERLLVGFSGGADSLTLLRVLAGLRDSLGFELAACHVHHGLSAHADAWLAFCAEVCKELDIEFLPARVAVGNARGLGLEAAARAARYAVFEQQRADWIVLAHHRDDQAETVLFNLLRGTGLIGAAGMKERHRRYLRPFLGVSRAEILAYARQKGWRWIEDESNRDLRHTRNYLRHEILPRIERHLPAARKNLAAAASRFAEASALLDELARQDLGGADAFPLPVAQLQALSEARATNALRYLLQQQGVLIPSAGRLKEAIRQLCGARPERMPSVGLGAWKLVRRQGVLFLEPKEGK
ncbi:MAG: tRNA lysidine(34) synthetase TilS [Rhodocyclaceae bacterium]|nr:tRNA lysidine(34) synthetase TilS [Rhodocyclaceae bacterium]